MKIYNKSNEKSVLVETNKNYYNNDTSELYLELYPTSRTALRSIRSQAMKDQYFGFSEKEMTGFLENGGLVIDAPDYQTTFKIKKFDM
jgi:hypothetical protein